MADQNNVNQLIEAMKTSIVALNDTMRNYNLKIMDSFKVFQSLDNTLKSFTDNLSVSAKNVNAELQTFATTLKEAVLPNDSFNALNADLQNSSEALRNFSQNLSELNSVNESVQAMKTSIVAVNDSIRDYNVRIIDSLKAFQNLDNTLKSFTDNLNAGVKNVNAELQTFADKLKQATLPDKSNGALTSDVKNSSEALKNFAQNLNDNTANLKDFGSELNKLSQSVASTTQAITAAGTEVKSADSKSPSTVRKKTGLKATDKAAATPKDSKSAAAGKGGGGALEGALGRVQMAFTFVKKVVETGVKSIALFNAALLASVVTFQMFTNRVKSYVQAYNPNIVKQFDYVLKDITAVIGKALQPVLIALGASLRQLGDILVPVMDALSPAFQSLAKAVTSFLLPIFNALGNALIKASPMINKIADEFAKLAGELGEVIAQNMPELISYLIDYLRNWVETLKAYKNVAGPFIQIWSKFNRAFLQAGNILLGYFNSFADYMKKIAAKLRSWLDWFGITTKGKNYVGTNVEPAKTGNSTGMAAREAEYMNVEDLSRGLIKAAYGSGQDIQRQQLEQQRIMNGQLAQINAKIGNRNLQPQAFQPGLRMA